MIRLIFTVLFFPIFANAISLKLEHFNGPTPKFAQSAEGVSEIHGPSSLRAIPSELAKEGNWVLEMEYFCVGGVPSFAVLFGPNFESKQARYIPAIDHSETWRLYTARLCPPNQPLPAGWTQLRFDLPLKADQILQLRNVRIRPELAGEFDQKISTAAAAPKSLEEYLSEKFPATISQVAVATTQIIIKGNSGGQLGNLFLADVPMEVLLDSAKPYESLMPITVDQKNDFSLTLPRIGKRHGRDYDRLLSRWQLYRQTETGYEPISHGHYADEVACRSPQLPPKKPASKKGLGGWVLGPFPNELEELGIAAVTINVFAIHRYVSLQPRAGFTPFQWQGKTYYANEKLLEGNDRILRDAEKRGVMVSAILLISNPAQTDDAAAKLLGHPDALKEGTYAMPNVTSADGIDYYGAIINLMAERWSKNDGVHGRINHWIIHNEVDCGWVWTNCGDKPAIVYMDLYLRSMRLVSLIAHQYDPNARSFITLTHHWAEAGNPHYYGSKRMMELLENYCRAEGDFSWALAYHPYPQNLFNPRAWEDHQATFDFNTKKITPKNIEVLDAYMKKPELLYRGNVRPVHLSENGFNSKDYSEKSLTDQAAGMALAWKKIATLSSIESWQYHNWIDNRAEGGLRIGLRKFTDEPGDPAGKKPIWHLYQALGTKEEDQLAAPYLKTIGITDWNQALYQQPIR